MIRELTEYAPIAQLVERIHGKDEVTGSNPVWGSSIMLDNYSKEGVSGSNPDDGSKLLSVYRKVVFYLTLKLLSENNSKPCSF